MTETQFPQMPDPGIYPPGGVFPGEIRPSRDPAKIAADEVFRRQESTDRNSQAEEISVTQKELAEAVEKLNNLADGINSRLKFGLYGDTDQLYVQVIDRQSNRTVKVLPPEKLLELRNKLQNAVGVILDEIF